MTPVFWQKQVKKTNKRELQSQGVLQEDKYVGEQEVKGFVFVSLRFEISLRCPTQIFSQL